jgi:C1A family cysteine protease
MAKEELYGGAVDKPDPRDYKAVHLLGAEIGGLPDEVDLFNTNAKNQGNSMKCTAYALTHVFEILNRLEHHLQIVLSADEQWSNQKADGGASEAYGDSLQHAMKILKDKGLKNREKGIDLDKFTITGYARVNHSENSFKEWLSRGYPIYTGGTYTGTNFKLARRTGYWSGIDGKRISGHAFAIVGYDNNGFKALNSYGKDWGKFKNGTFYIPYNKTQDTYNGYIVFDTKDIKMIYRDVSEKSPYAEAIKICLDNQVLRGHNSDNIYDPKDRFFKPNQAVTKAELAQFGANLIKKFNLQ